MKTAKLILCAGVAIWLSAAFSTPKDARKTQLIQDLKQQIVQVSDPARGRVDAPSAIRSKLDPLVDQLVSLVADRSEAEKLSDVVGCWHELWSDGPSGLPDRAPDAPFYQAVFPNGYFWNVGQENPSGRVLTSFLRGQYRIDEDGLKVRFTKAVAQNGWPVIGTDMTQLAMKAEVGTFDASPRDFNPTVSPIDKTMHILDVYADEDLRISRSGGGDYPGQYLYIWERQSELK